MIKFRKSTGNYSHHGPGAPVGSGAVQSQVVDVKRLCEAQARLSSHN